jgi:hypothetical protein
VEVAQAQVVGQALEVDLDLIPALVAEVEVTQRAEVARKILLMAAVQIVVVKSQGRKVKEREKMKKFLNGNQMVVFMMLWLL